MKSLVLALILSLSACNAPQGALPNDCALTATEALSRLKDTTPWSREIFLTFFYTHSFRIGGHAMTLWQVYEGGEILAYDEDGTYSLHTSSHEIKDIIAALNKADSGWLIFSARFVE